MLSVLWVLGAPCYHRLSGNHLGVDVGFTVSVQFNTMFKVSERSVSNAAFVMLSCRPYFGQSLCVVARGGRIALKYLLGSCGPHTGSLGQGSAVRVVLYILGESSPFLIAGIPTELSLHSSRDSPRCAARKARERYAPSFIPLSRGRRAPKGTCGLKM